MGWVSPVYAQGDRSEEAALASEVDPAAKRLLAAGGLYRAGRFDAAVEEYAQFLKAYPKHPSAASAHYGKGAAHFQLGQYEQAGGEMRAALGDEAFEQRADGLFVLAQAELRLGDAEAALEPLGEILEKHADSPRGPAAAAAQVQAMLTLGRDEAAVAAAEALLKASGEEGAGGDASLLYLGAVGQSRLGRHEAAAAWLQRLLERVPNSPYTPDAMLLLGQSLEAADQLEAAAERYEALIQTLPEPRRDVARYSLGVLRYKQGRYEDAISQLEAVLKESPESGYRGAATLQLGVARLAAGQLDAAAKTLEPLLEKEGVGDANAEAGLRDQAMYWLAEVDLEAKRYDEAAARLGGLLERDPPVANVEAVSFDHALALSLGEQHEVAAAAFGRFQEQFPKSPQSREAGYRRAYSLFQEGSYEETIQAAGPVAVRPKEGELPPAFAAESMELVGEAQLRLGRFEEAAETFDALAQRAEKEGGGEAERRAAMLLRSGRAVFAAGDYAGAVARLEPVVRRKDVEKDESLQEAVYLSASALLQTGEDERAAELFERYEKVAPVERRDEVRYQAAVARLRSGDEKAAREGFARVIKGDAGSPWTQRALLQTAQLAYRAGDLDEAGAAVERLVKAKPTADLAAPAEYLLATLQLQEGKPAEAAAAFGRVREGHADHPLADDAAYQEAVALRVAGEEQRAIEAAERYLKDRPGGGHVAEARYLLGVARADTGDAAAAIRQLEPLAEAEATRTPRVLYDLAWAYRQAEQNERAVATYRRLMEMKGDAESDAQLRGSARAELGDLLYAAEEFGPAAEVLRAAAADKDAPAAAKQNAAYRLGWAVLKTGDAAAAAEAFAGFAKTYPKHELAADALYQSAAAAVTAGDLAAAEERLGTLLDRYKESPLARRAGLQLGDARLDRGRYAQAADAYRAYLEQYKEAEDRYRAQFGLGFALQNQDKLDEAKDWYGRVIESHNGETAARAQYQLGTLYIKQKQPQKAIDELLKVDIIYNAPTWAATALVEAGGVLQGQNQPDEAAKLYQRVVDEYADTEAAALAKKRLAAIAK